MTPLRVCIISPGELPVPATRGGAIESLIMSLVTCNETQRQHNVSVAMTVASRHRAEMFSEDAYYAAYVRLLNDNNRR